MWCHVGSGRLACAVLKHDGLCVPHVCSGRTYGVYALSWTAVRLRNIPRVRACNVCVPVVPLVVPLKVGNELEPTGPAPCKGLSRWCSALLSRAQPGWQV
jgi:hypothetical protein